MSFSVSDDRGQIEYNGHSLNTLFAQRRNLLRPRFYRMLADIVRFNRTAPRWAAVSDETLTVGEFLARHRYSQEFAAHYLLPMGAAIWSCPVGSFAEFPLRFLVDFYRNHGLLAFRRRPEWRVVAGGSRTYVQALLKGLRAQVRCARRSAACGARPTAFAWCRAAGRRSCSIM